MLRFLLAEFFPDAHSLFDFLNIVYYTCIVLGIFIAGILVRTTLLRFGYSRKKVHIFISLLVLAVFPTGFLSSRLANIFSYPISSWSMGLVLQQIISGNSHIFHASLVLPGLGVLGLVIVLGFQVRETFDVLFCHLPLAHALGRVGCLLVGCCWGYEISLSFFGSNYTFTNPVPVYSIFLNTVLYFSLKRVLHGLYFSHRGFFASRRKGLIIGLYFVCYGVFRFVIEFLRTNELLAIGLTRPQVVMLVFILLGLVITGLTMRRRPLLEN